MNSVFKFFRESLWARILIPIGLILVIFSIFVFISVKSTNNYIKTEAVVSKMELYSAGYTDEEGDYVEPTYTVYVKYTVKDVEYETELGTFSGYHVGDSIKIKYNPNNPEDISQSVNYILPIILLSAGIASMAGGVVSIFVAIKKHKALKEQEKEWVHGK